MGQAVSNVLPITYFLRMVRFALLGQTSVAVEMNLLYLVLTMIATIVVGLVVFRIAMYKARRDGLIDRKEEY